MTAPSLRFLCGLLMCALGGGVQAAVTRVEPLWQYLPQSPINATSAPIFADLDGDGINEIVLLGNSSNSVFSDAVIGVLELGTLGFNLSSTLPLAGAASSGLVPVFHEGKGATFLLSKRVGGQFVIDEIGGKPLRLLRRLTQVGDLIVQQVDDLTGDGELEVLAIKSFSGTAVGTAIAIRYADGSVVWEGVDTVRENLVAVDLTSTPSLRVLAPGSPGLMILDGSSGASGWTFPSGFLGGVLAGRFSSNLSVSTFGTVSSGAGIQFTVFRSGPYSPIIQFPVQSSSVTRYDVDGDGIDELLVAPSSSGGSDFLQLINPIDGVVLRQIPAQYRGMGKAALGRVEDDSPVLLGYGSRSAGSKAGGVVIMEIESGEEVYDARTEIGPYSAVGFADRDGDGEEEVVLISFKDTGAISLSVFDKDGRTVGASTLQLPNGWFGTRPRLALADVDGSGRDDILVALTGTFGSKVGVVNGGDLSARWWSDDSPNSPLISRLIQSVGTADFDGDGLPDLVLGTRTFGGGWSILVLSGLSGEVIWEWAGLPPVVAVFAESDRVFVSTANTLHALDVETRQLLWTFESSAGRIFSEVNVWGVAEDCFVGVLVNNDLLARHRCGSGDHVGDILLESGTDFFLPMDEDGGYFASGGDGVLRVHRFDGKLLMTSDFLGNELQTSVAHGVRFVPGSVGLSEIVVGSVAKMSKFRLDVESIFASGFEDE